MMRDGVSRVTRHGKKDNEVSNSNETRLILDFKAKGVSPNRVIGVLMRRAYKDCFELSSEPVSESRGIEELLA